jgi:hypothetical protein
MQKKYLIFAIASLATIFLIIIFSTSKEKPISLTEYLSASDLANLTRYQKCFIASELPDSFILDTQNNFHYQMTSEKISDNSFSIKIHFYWDKPIKSGNGNRIILSLDESEWEFISDPLLVLISSGGKIKKYSDANSVTFSGVCYELSADSMSNGYALLDITAKSLCDKVEVFFCHIDRTINLPVAVSSPYDKVQGQTIRLTGIAA